MKYSVKINNQSEAIENTIDYLGVVKFVQIVQMLQNGKYATITDKLRSVHMCFGLLGVAGYALHHHLYRHIFK